MGLENFRIYFDTPALFASITNSLSVAISATLIVLGIAFVYAYALTRTRMPLRWFFRGVALIPILAPSLLAAISLIYWFGNQGVLKSWLGGGSIYGPVGIIIGSCFWVFPHALMILLTALSTADARLYEAAEALRTPKWRVFWTVTLPGAKYGILSAGFVVFTLVITDFGVPKVIGGRYNVLATDVYKQVVGQQNFEMGAVVSLVLLLPALVAFIADRWVQRKQVALLSARAVPYQPKSEPLRDGLLFIFCTIVAVMLLAMIAMAAYASFVTFWPYNLTLSLKNYNFDVMDGGGWGVFQLHPHGDLLCHFWDGPDFRRRLLGGKGTWCLMASYPAAPCSNASACRSRTRPRYCLYFLLQPSGQPPRLSLRNHGHPGDLHHRSLLYRQPPDLPHRAEATGP